MTSRTNNQDTMHTTKTKEIDQQKDTERQIDEHTRHNVNNQMQEQKPMTAGASHQNDDHFRTDWKQWKEKVSTKWNKLTDDDLKQIEGSRHELVKALERRYSYDRPRAQKEVSDFLGKP